MKWGCKVYFLSKVTLSKLSVGGTLFIKRRKYSFGDITIIGKELQSIGLWSALIAFEQGGIFIVPQLMWHRASVLLILSEGLPHLAILTGIPIELIISQ